MQDLSDLAKNSMWPTSQAGGNMIASNDQAMTAPGSAPVDNLNDRMSEMEEEPTVIDSNLNEIPPATSGKPQASGQQGKPSTPTPAWGSTTTPTVVRDDSGAVQGGTKSPLSDQDGSRAAERESRRVMSKAWKSTNGVSGNG
jgi:hypothetical protein